MPRFLRILSLVLSLLIVGESLWIWQSTGRRWFTQYYRADLDPANTPPDALDATLREAGLYDAGGPSEQVDFQFRLGLFPSGFTGQALSVTSLAVPALLLGLTAVIGRGKPLRS